MNEVIVIENDRPVTTPILAISAIAVTASVSLGGCGGGEASRHATTELALETSQIRHDLEPLDKRFPAIGNPNAATWISGTVGAQTGSRVTVPGPSVYWIEAIIKLEPTTADTLRSNYAPKPTAEVPDLDQRLQSDVPAGTFLTSPTLDTALSNNDWRSTAYLHSGSNTLVMRSVDD